MNKSESKYFATAVRMDEAFLRLLEKKDFAYITVKELCETAGVHRSTFYLIILGTFIIQFAGTSMTGMINSTSGVLTDM